ncbi:hypothetical protein AB838_20290 [Rhodobacteraceae bacterium (ex Bugula neritina AB1)]|nr:hypothetical protein AB838_20290 [Rhodobacteraceae bacterium (ex Bugula neritina AB1)]
MASQVKTAMGTGDCLGEAKFTGGHELTIVAGKNGGLLGGDTCADGQGKREDGRNCGALCKAEDAGLAAMGDPAEIWRSERIPVTRGASI